MLYSVLFCALLVFISTNGAPVDDFSETNGGGYEFVFHNTQNLFLVLKDTSCYFIPTKDSLESLSFGTDDLKHQTEADVTWIIEHQKQSVIPKTLDDVRDLFGDVLADFRCNNKNIFVVDPLLVLSTPTPAPDAHSTQVHNSGNFWELIFGHHYHHTNN